MHKNKSLIGNNPYLYELDEVEGFDINPLSNLNLQSIYLKIDKIKQ
jgi:hypothetical protein